MLGAMYFKPGDLGWASLRRGIMSKDEKKIPKVSHVVIWGRSLPGREQHVQKS